MKLHEKLPRGLRQIVAVGIKIEILVRGADVENRKGIQLVAQQRLDIEAAAEIVVLGDQAQKQLAGELIIEARPQNIAVKNLTAVGVMQFGIRVLRLDDEALHRLNGRPHLEIVAPP